MEGIMIIYVVKQGDTLTSIAQEFGTTAENIIEENGITNRDKLVIGQTIVLNTAETEKLGNISNTGYAYPNIDREVLRQTLPYLTSLVIFTYGFTPEGELIGIDDEELIAIAREGGVAPIMMISTLTTEGTFSNELSNQLLNNIAVQDILINNIIANMNAKNYFGLEIDFEFVFPEDRDAYSAFVEKLTSRLNAEGYEVLTALAPKTSSTQMGLLYESHDYERLGQVSDAVLLMTYEWGYTYGPPMAVSPINKVREVLDYAVTVIPPEKIFMGMPNYGYDWTLPFVRGESRAASLGNVAAVERAAEFNTVIQYDEVAQAPFYYYYDTTGKQHVVWFEDARSVDAKVRLVSEYGFQGIGVWNVMKFFPQMWLVIGSLFNINKLL